MPRSARGEDMGWARIVRERSVNDFLSEENHVVVIKIFFLRALDELEKIKNKYSKLPWGASQGNEESADDVFPATQKIFPTVE